MENSPISPVRLLCCTSTMESGGSERQMLQLLHGIDRSRVVPHLYLTYESGPLLGSIPQDVVVDSFAKHYSRRYALVPGSLYALQLRKLRQVAKQHHIEVTYDRLYHTVMLTAAAFRGRQIARVVTVVSPPSRDFGQSRQRWMTIKRAILGWSYRSASKLLAVSQESADDASAFYKIAPERWNIIPSPIDYDTIRRQATENDSIGVRSGSHELQIVVVGRLSHEKNHRMLLGVLQQLKLAGRRTHLHIIGDGVLRGDLEKEVRELQLDREVTFHGVQANPHAIVARCDVLCLPSLYEGFPNVVMEAMVNRTPVIASTAAGGLKLLLGDNQRGRLLSPLDSDAWVRALLEFPGKSALADQVEQADLYVQTHHSLPVWTAQMQQIFIQAARRVAN